MLGKFFKGAGGSESPPSTVKTVPVPDRYRPLIVDADGHEVRDRLPTVDDFVACAPVKYSLAGTFPEFKHDPKKSRAENEAEALDILLEGERNAALLDRAVFFLSQIPEGRRLLKLMEEQKFAFEFDRAMLDERGAAGLCDYTRKRVPLHPASNEYEMALTVMHELGHMEDGLMGLTYHAKQRLPGILMMSRAMEASARVREALACIQAQRVEDRAPANAFVTTRLMTAFEGSCPVMAQTARAAKADELPVFAAKVFESFYSEDATLSFYDTDMLKLVSRDLPAFDIDVQDYAFDGMRGAIKSQNEIMEALSIAGEAFGDQVHADLSDRRHIGLTPGGMAGLNTLKYRLSMLNADLSPEAQRDMALLAVYKREPSAVVQKGAGNARKARVAVEPIILAGNIDGGMTTAGIRSHAHTRENLLTAIERAPFDKALDQAKMAVEDMLRYKTSHVTGFMADLVDAGFRAPIAVMPEEYLRHLLQGVEHFMKDPANNAGDFSRTDLLLMAHWRDMAKAGIDPLFGGLEGPMTHRDRDANYWGAKLAKSFEALMAESIKVSEPDLKALVAAGRTVPIEQRGPHHPIKTL